MTDLLFVLAIWRLSKLLMTDDGPFDIIARARTRLGVYEYKEYGERVNFWRGLLSCIYCTSLWVSAFFVLALMLANIPLDYPIARIFAYSGGAVLVENWIDRS